MAYWKCHLSANYYIVGARCGTTDRKWRLYSEHSAPHDVMDADKASLSLPLSTILFSSNRPELRIHNSSCFTATCQLVLEAWLNSRPWWHYWNVSSLRCLCTYWDQVAHFSSHLDLLLYLSIVFSKKCNVLDLLLCYCVYGDGFVMSSLHFMYYASHIFRKSYPISACILDLGSPCPSEPSVVQISFLHVHLIPYLICRTDVISFYTWARGIWLVRGGFLVYEK